MRKLDGLKPEKVFYYFEEISKIPRGSKNEKAISDYFVKFANDKSLSVVQDEKKNVIIYKGGTKGKENSDAVIMQCHMDMVCEKNKDTEHDFLTQGINLKVDGDMVSGTGTTLGADNGVGVAYCLALLDSDDVVHPPVHVIITVEEETGMDGAKQLDLSNINAKYMINVDSDYEGVFCTSCAGGTKSTGKIKINKAEVSKDKYEGFVVKVRGLHGGHSGIEIHKERGNANRIMGRVVSRLIKECDVYAYDINGGSKDNAIPRECDLFLMVNKEEVQKVKDIVSEFDNIVKKEYAVTDANVSVTVDVADCVTEVFDKDTTMKLATILMLTPNGVIAMSTTVEGLVETSNNLGVVSVKGDNIEIVNATRSSVASRKKYVGDMIYQLYAGLGCEIEFYGDYPGWEFNPKSELQKISREAFVTLFDKEPAFEAIHAGLECGYFAEKIEGIDIISFGPNMYDIHTPDEHVSVSSVERNYNLLLEILKNL